MGSANTDTGAHSARQRLSNAAAADNASDEHIEAVSPCGNSDDDEIEADMADEWAAADLPEMPDGIDSENTSSRHARQRNRTQPSKSCTPPKTWRGTHIVVGTANVNGLGTKAADLALLLHNKKYFKHLPDIWALTEIDGKSGVDNIRQLLGKNISRFFDVYWSQRTTDSDGNELLASRQGRVGGGVAILVNRRLNMQARTFNISVEPVQQMWVRGHVMAIQLDPAPVRAGQHVKPWWPQRPMVVTVAYAPPPSKQWGKPEIREAIFSAVHSVETAVQTLRQFNDVYPITLFHTNAPDMACPVPLVLRYALTASEMQDGIMTAARKSQGKPGAQLMVRDGDIHPLLQRHQCKSAAKQPTTAANGEGRAVSAAKAGMVAIDGTVRHREPDSFTKVQCPSCKAQGYCKCETRSRPELRDVHDPISIAADEVWRALTCAKRPAKFYIAPRVRWCQQGDNFSWATGIDHCVTTCRLFLGVGETQKQKGGVKAVQLALDTMPKRKPRYRSAANLLHNNQIKHEVARLLDSGFSNMFSVLAGDDEDVEAINNASMVLVQNARAVATSMKTELSLIKQAGPIHAKRRQARRLRRELDQARAALEAELAERNKLAEADVATHEQIKQHRSESHAKRASERQQRKMELERAHVARIKLFLADIKAGRSPVVVVPLTAQRDATSEHQAAAKSSVQLARSHWHKLKRQLRCVTRAHDRQALRNHRTNAPKEWWRLMRKWESDDGLPGDGPDKLLQYLTNEKGETIASTTSECKRLAQEHRREVFSVPTDLSQKAEDLVSESLAMVSVYNAHLCEVNSRMHEQSAVAQSARDPLVSWRSIDERRSKPRRNLDARLAQLQIERRLGHGAFAAYEKALKDHPLSCQALSATITDEEVSHALSRVVDGGNGTDGLEPVLFTGHDVLHKCKCDECERVRHTMPLDDMLDECVAGCSSAVALARFFNLIIDQGLLPKMWQIHRCLLHYKGKSSDPHCLDNYRGLGIDQALLKILSLVFEERIMKHVETTKALSSTQGGFLRQRGTPEMAVVLSEAVRANSKGGRKTHLNFIDTRRAYDSVLHPILWKRCLDIGIGGKCLAVLQAIYFNAHAQLDIGGTLLDPVLLECGVLQGNPLSPVLYNIYQDGAVKEFERRICEHRRKPGECLLGVTFPKDCNDLRPIDPCKDQDAFAAPDDRLTHLFYADDGVLIALSRTHLQMLTDWLVDALEPLGLRINAKKTKCMLITTQHDRKSAYAEAEQAPLRVCREVIELVDEFDYLGVRFNCQWNWRSAWCAAGRRAMTAYQRARIAAFDEKGDLHSQLQYARNKIFSHFTYIAAIAGAGGAASSAYYKNAEQIQHRVLRHIAGYAFANTDVVMAEAGMWDLRTFIDMLLLRFWCKITVSSPDSLARRAIAYSMRTIDLSMASSHAVSVGMAAQTKHVATNVIHKQSWAQQLIAAASRLNLDIATVQQLRISAVVNVEQQVVSAAGLMWTTVDPFNPPAAVGAPGLRRLRLRAVDDNRVVQEGINCWTVPDKATPASVTDIFRNWTSTLKEAIYGALRRRGNHRRQMLVRETVAAIENPTATRSHQYWWGVFTSASVLQPYWFCGDLMAARRMLRLRAGQACHEGYIRTRPYTHAITSQAEVCIPRVENPHLRACYMCDKPIDESKPRVFLPETLEHFLIVCGHPELVRIREAARNGLTALAEQSPLDAPDFSHDTALLTALLLGTSRGNDGVTTNRPDHDANVESKRDSAQINFSPAIATTTSEWVAALTTAWMQKCRAPHDTSTIDCDIGCQLTTLVAETVKSMFIAHNKTCRGQTNVEYLVRARDAVVNEVKSSTRVATVAAKASGKRIKRSISQRANCVALGTTRQLRRLQSANLRVVQTRARATKAARALQSAEAVLQQARLRLLALQQPDFEPSGMAGRIQLRHDIARAQANLAAAEEPLLDLQQTLREARLALNVTLRAIQKIRRVPVTTRWTSKHNLLSGKAVVPMHAMVGGSSDGQQNASIDASAVIGLENGEINGAPAARFHPSPCGVEVTDGFSHGGQPLRAQHHMNTLAGQGHGLAALHSDSFDFACSCVSVCVCHVSTGNSVFDFL